jgi:uncharacterized repeat protein (TIGR01451 family)
MKTRRALSRLLGAGLIVGALATAGPAASAYAQGSGPVPFSQADFHAYATGTAVHVGALRLGNTQIANVEVGFSGASVASDGTNTLPGQGPGAAQGTIVNEMHQVVQPTLPDSSSANLSGDRSFAQGAGLQLGLVNGLPVDNNELNLNDVQVSAPGPTSNSQQFGPISINPVAYASLIKGQAAANWTNSNSCILGAPISQGVGYAADAELLNTGSTGTGQIFTQPIVATDVGVPAQQAVTQSVSETVLAPQTNAQGQQLGTGLGVLSETAQQIAPITLFKGTPAQTEILVGGVWDLKVFAGGIPGTSWVSYAPAPNQSPSTPVLTILQGLSKVTTSLQVTLQQLLGKNGLNLSLPNQIGNLAYNPILGVSIGQAPRAIGGAPGSSPTISANGTTTSAAVDVLSLEVNLGSNLGVVDLRVGHMEGSVTVPPNGIGCSIGVNKTANPSVINPGQSFTYNINVTNPCQSTLTNVGVTDTIATTPGVQYTITDETPAGSVSTSGNQSTITFSGLPDIPPNGTQTLTITVNVPSSSAAGTFTDIASASGSCSSGSGITGTGVAPVSVALTGGTTVHVPTVTTSRVVPVTSSVGPTSVVSPPSTAPSKALPFTGLSPAIPLTGLGLALVGGLGLAVRRRVIGGR